MTSNFDQIPKIIHYCWFGNAEIPKIEQKCIASWSKYLIGYQIHKWTESNFNIHINKYVEEAYEENKMAYVSDYLRLYAVYNYGGIYLDTDVMVNRTFDDLLNNIAFTGFGGDNREIAAHIIGAQKNQPLIKEFLDSYNHRKFKIEDGKYDLTTINIAISRQLEKHGFTQNGKEQTIDGLRIYPMTYFCPQSFMPDTVKDCYSKLTYCDHIWSDPGLKRDKNPIIKFCRAIGLNKVKRLLQR